MPKVDITINLCTFECIDLVGSMLMFVHACMQDDVMPYFGLAVNILIVFIVVGQ